MFPLFYNSASYVIYSLHAFIPRLMQNNGQYQHGNNAFTIVSTFSIFFHEISNEKKCITERYPQFHVIQGKYKLLFRCPRMFRYIFKNETEKNSKIESFCLFLPVGQPLN